MTGMPADLQRFAATASADTICAALRADGVVIVEGVVDRKLLDELNRDIDPLVAMADPAMRHLNPTLDAFFGKHLRHVSGMAGKSHAFAERVVCHPVFLAMCDRILLPNCASYVLNLGHVMDRGPGSEAQWPHRDEGIWIHFPQPHFELELAAMVAMVDFRRDNGATWIVPGSHRWPKERQPLDEERRYAEMAAGSAVIYLGSTLHGGGANTTADEWRRGLHLSYALGWLRTEENNVLAVPPQVARGLSPLARRLIGYGVHDAIADNGGFLGMVDMRDPVDLLDEGKL